MEIRPIFVLIRSAGTCEYNTCTCIPVWWCIYLWKSTTHNCAYLKLLSYFEWMIWEACSPDILYYVAVNHHITRSLCVPWPGHVPQPSPLSLISSCTVRYKGFPVCIYVCMYVPSYVHTYVCIATRHVLPACNHFLFRLLTLRLSCLQDYPCFI